MGMLRWFNVLGVGHSSVRLSGLDCRLRGRSTIPDGEFLFRSYDLDLIMVTCQKQIAILGW